MSYKNPITPSLTSLKGVDKKIEDIRTQMSFTWLEEVFGLADRVRHNDGFIPVCFEGNRVDPISMLPSDIHKAYCFWIKEPSATAETGNNYPNRNPILTYNVSCIFYLDIRRIDNTLTYKETKSKIREDIFNFFNNVHLAGELTYTGCVEDDMDAIFADYTIDETYKMYPKWAIRLNFELSFRDGCYTTNTYSIT
jgi:hypothetical protein